MARLRRDFRQYIPCSSTNNLSNMLPCTRAAHPNGDQPCPSPTTRTPSTYGPPTFCARITAWTPTKNRSQASGGRIDIEVRIGPVKIALEAEQGQNAAKKREAIRDADNRLKRKEADCAIAICYPDGISGKAQLLDSRMLWTIRAPNNLVPASDANWSDASLGELASIVKLAPMQVGDPDLAAKAICRRDWTARWAGSANPKR